MKILQQLIEFGHAEFMFLTKKYRLEYNMSKKELVLVCRGPKDA